MEPALLKLIATEPKYRKEQIYLALFNPKIENFDQITTLSKELRQKLRALSWFPFVLADIKESNLSGAKKALLRLSDDELIETVLMERQSKKVGFLGKRYTVCLSTQVGCPMRCSFCATGKLGFKRNLSVEEIIGQFRFWQKHLHKNKLAEIDNIVLMGQGEPLLNYEAVKESINLFLKYLGIGPRKITLSTAGVIAGMNKIVEDPDFPPIRFALSLHSAIEDDRKKLMPAQPADFFEFLIKWSKKYHKRWPSRTHFIGIEYIFISGVNDSDKHLKALFKLISKIGRVRINLIPLNPLGDEFVSTELEIIKTWQKKLMESGYTTTVRLSQGQDIAAACGQLKNIYDSEKSK